MAFQNGRYYDEYNPANYYNTPGRQGVWDPTGSYAKSLQPGNLNMPGLPTGGTPNTTTAQNTPSFLTNTPQDVTRGFFSGSQNAGDYWNSLGIGGNTAAQIGSLEGNKANQPQGGSWDFRSGSPVFVPFQNTAQNQSLTSPVNTGNISGLPTAQPDLASITDLVNKLNLNAQQQSNANRILGASGLEQQSSNNIASLLAGNIPSDVVRNLTQNAAERGISMGSPGGANANASLLQALDLTSLGLQQQGQANLTSALGRNPGAPIFDPTTQLLTPAQKLEAEARANALGLEWWKALYGNRGTGGSGRGTGGGGTQPTTSNNDWFANAFRQATGGVGVNPMPRNAPPTTTGGTYSTPTSPYQATGLNDASNPSYWDWNNQMPFMANAGVLPWEDPTSQDYWNWDNPTNWNTDTGLPFQPTTDTSTNLNTYYDAGYDPFSGYYDPGMATDLGDAYYMGWE